MRRFDFQPFGFMVVDANDYMRHIQADMLRSIGAGKVIEARDGSSALEAMRTNDIDLVLTDWMMEPMDGLAFVRAVRAGKHCPNPRVTIIMLSSHTEDWRVRKARDIGVNEYLAKPTSLEVMAERIVHCFAKPRFFVRTREYFGPDRRRHPADPTCQFKRRTEDQGSPEEAAAG